MKGSNLGEFEELVLLTIGALVNDAYSVGICDELERQTKRSVKLGVVHAVLNRLEEKGSHTNPGWKAEALLHNYQRGQICLVQIKRSAG
jgi:hypothetical protein